MVDEAHRLKNNQSKVGSYCVVMMNYRVMARIAGEMFTINCRYVYMCMYSTRSVLE